MYLGSPIPNLVFSRSPLFLARVRLHFISLCYITLRLRYFSYFCIYRIIYIECI